MKVSREANVNCEFTFGEFSKLLEVKEMLEQWKLQGEVAGNNKLYALCGKVNGVLDEMLGFIEEQVNSYEA